jgi:outer membrane protein OmpA-like peptidoglycan-associated protein
VDLYQLSEVPQPASKYFVDGEDTVKRKFRSVVSRALIVIPFVFCFLTASLSYAQQDAKGCTDNPYLTRFPGSTIELCASKDDDTYNFPVGSARKEIEGKLNHVLYNIPAAASSAQVGRNLMTALRQANWKNIYMNGSSTEGTWQKNGVYLFVSVGGGRYHVVSVTLTQLTQDVTASAAELSKGIDANGHAVVPGILFDTGKADVKDESKPALDEVAKLLSQDTKLKLYVVGHTDNVGSVGSNVELSKRRAAAVITVLVSKYHIAPARLDSFGNGPYAPVASNDNEDGRAQNRRVEIVKQ